MAEQNNSKALWQWETFVSPHHSRGLWWHVGVGIITLGLVAYAVFYEESWSMAAVMGLLGLMVFLYSKEAPRKVSITISEAGVDFDNKFYSYQDCKSFWILQEGSYQALCLDLAKSRKTLTLPLEEISPDEIRELLLKHLPENSKGHELFVDKWARRLKF
ncbi:MAG: hypothetical protein PHU71_00225 [Candidatus Gracilibacteria bacterium]|nr:hypothetical protein [Candidatus Gracilibacteria bacterium]